MNIQLFKKDPWPVIDQVLKYSRRTLLYGPPGTGKTNAGLKSGLNEGQEVLSITMTDDMSAARLEGYDVIRDGNFQFRYGTAVEAYTKGHRLVINEINLASGDSLSFLLNILDDIESSQMTLATGETIRPHKDFTCVATMNGHPDELPFALRDRFTVCIEVDAVHPDAIKALPEDLQQVALNSAILKDTERRVSIRAWKEFAKLRTYMPPEVAALVIFGDRAEELINSLKVAAVE